MQKLQIEPGLLNAISYLNGTLDIFDRVLYLIVALQILNALFLGNLVIIIFLLPFAPK